MNVITIIVVATIGIDLLLNAWADYVNIKILSPELPRQFKAVYDPERYRKSQEYLKINTRFGWITRIVDIALLLIFWFAKGFFFLDQSVRSWDLNPILSGLLYIGILALIKAVLTIPFSIYGTFVIEERFGFNKTTWPTFGLDLLKGFLLALALGTPLLAGLLAFFEYAGTNAWLYCWVGITLYMLAVQFIAPTWIMPLFNKFKPLEKGALKTAILSYADSIKFPLENVFVMDGSRRSRKSNAFFTGFGKHKRIALFDTLLQQQNPKGLVAILAHEMGHYKKKHILFGMVLSILQTGLMLYLLSFFISYPALFEAFYMNQTSVYGGLIFFAILYSPLDLLIGILLQMVSRRNEREADRFAAETTGDPLAMTDALKKLSADNLTNLTPHPFYVFLNYSHPPILQRIKAIAKYRLPPALSI